MKRVLVNLVALSLLADFATGCASIERMRSPDGLTKAERNHKATLASLEADDRANRTEIEWNAKLLDLEPGMSRVEVTQILGRPKRVELVDGQFIQTYRMPGQRHIWVFFTQQDQLIRWSDDSGEVKPTAPAKTIVNAETSPRH